MNHVVAHSMESELPLYRQLHATQPPNTMAWIVDERPFFRFIAERFTDCLDPTAVTKKRLESAFSTFNRTSSDAILTHVDSGDRITVGAMQRDPKYFGLRPNDRHLFKEYLNLSLGTDELGRMAAIEGARGDAIENWQEMHKERWKAHTLYLPTAMLDLAYNPLKEYADALANNTLDKEFIQIKIAVASMYSLIPAPAFGRFYRSAREFRAALHRHAPVAAQFGSRGVAEIEQIPFDNLIVSFNKFN